MEMFNDLMISKERAEVYGQISDFLIVLNYCLQSIIEDGSVADKTAVINECLKQFYDTAKISASSWSRGKVSDFEVKISEIQKKSFTDKLTRHIIKYNPNQPRDENGRWTDGGASAELMSRIKDGSVSTKIDTKKQNKHIEGTKEYKKAISNGGHPSRLTISAKEQQELVDKYIQEGTAVKQRDGSIRVEFTHDKIIGISCDSNGMKESKTKKRKNTFFKNRYAYGS